jgi:hypothetical protein
LRYKISRNFARKTTFEILLNFKIILRNLGLSDKFRNIYLQNFKKLWQRNFVKLILMLYFVSTPLQYILHYATFLFCLSYRTMQDIG